MSHEAQPIDEDTRSCLDSIHRGMWDFVTPFITPLGLVAPDDTSDPPGQHQGTGAFCLFNEHRYVVTCEHVAKVAPRATLTFAPFGAEDALSIANPFRVRPHPVDVAASALSKRSWELVTHSARCIPIDLIAEKHRPLDGEYLYVHGFPTGDTAVAFGTHHVRAIAFVTHECAYDPILKSEYSEVIEGFHICVSNNPAFAIELTNSRFGIPHKLSGMSGSFVWNTRYKEVSDQGIAWKPEHSRVSALVWADSQKAGAFIATPIEHIREFLHQLP